MHKFCLDPGHYGHYYNEGAVKGYYESEMVWDLTHYLRDELLKYKDVTVKITRTSIDEDVELTKRGAMAKGYDYFESIHSNAGPKGSTANWAAGIHLANDDNTDIDEKSKAFTQLMCKKVAECMGLGEPHVYEYPADWDRDGNGKLDDEYYGVNHGTKKVGTPGNITEHGFHTDAATCRWLMKDSNLKKLAKAKAEAYAEFFGLKLKPVLQKPRYKRKAFVGKYTAKAARALRYAPGVKSEKVITIPKGATVECITGCYGKSEAGNIWKYVTYYVGKKKYVGYVAPSKWAKLED